MKWGLVGRHDPWGQIRPPFSSLETLPLNQLELFQDTHTRTQTISLRDLLSFALLQTVWQHTHTHTSTYISTFSGHNSSVSLRPHRQLSYFCNGCRCRNNKSIWNRCMDEIMCMCYALNFHWMRDHSDSMTCCSHDITIWEVMLISG